MQTGSNNGVPKIQTQDVAKTSSSFGLEAETWGGKCENCGIQIPSSRWRCGTSNPTTMNGGVVHETLTHLREAVFDGDKIDAATLVEHLRAIDKEQRYPPTWLDAMASALRTGCWDGMSDAFRKRDFIGPQGHVLVLGPYHQRRDGVEKAELSLLCGMVLRRIDLEQVADASLELFGATQENPPEAIPIDVTFAAGAVGGENAGEAFVVPDGWAWKFASLGPAFNDMNEQSKRYSVALTCVERIFTPESAAMLIGLVSSGKGMLSIAADEYGLHDTAGHGNGIELSRKLDGNLLPNATYRGFEEFRADGLAMEIAGRVHGVDYATKIVASNLIVRLGVDAHRAGGMDTDTDVQCALLGLHHLFESKQLVTAPSGKLMFIEPTPEALWRATKPQRNIAVEVTQSELHLTRVEGLSWLYAKYFDMPECARSVFMEKVVTPCLGLHGLR